MPIISTPVKSKARSSRISLAELETVGKYETLSQEVKQIRAPKTYYGKRTKSAVLF